MQADYLQAGCFPPLRRFGLTAGSLAACCAALKATESLLRLIHSLWVSNESVLDPQSGGRLASGGDDQPVRLWDIADPADIRPLGEPIDAKIGWTWFLRFDQRDESRLFGVGDRLSALWYVDPEAVAEKFCASTATRGDEKTWRELLPSLPFIPPC